MKTILTKYWASLPKIQERRNHREPQSSNRSVYLTPNVSMIFEKIVFSRLLHHLKEHEFALPGTAPGVDVKYILYILDSFSVRDEHSNNKYVYCKVEKSNARHIVC